MKTQLKIRTEYSFRVAYGPIERVVDRLQFTGCKTAAITDRSSTFGHIAWNRHCHAKSIKPIFGVELAFTPDVIYKEKQQELYWLSLLARSNTGLREIYAAVEEASTNFYYVPRLPINKLDSFSDDVVILSGNVGLGQHPLPSKILIEYHPATNSKLPGVLVPVSDNYMITPSDRPVYEVMLGRGAFNRPSPMHIMQQDEFGIDGELADIIGNECNAEITPADNITIETDKTLLGLCLEGIMTRNLPWTDEYKNRLDRELYLIDEKGFKDYFLVIADMVRYAKQRMFVGPARGSSCGSLVCYLLGITDIDPIPHGLYFERFIDITRSDLPDIDIDFQDDKRNQVFEYLIEKYGADKVARLGTITRYKGRSAINETAKAVKIKAFEAEEIADSIIKRMDGDDRADFCIIDTFTDTDIGKAFADRFPAIQVAAQMEAHARHYSVHAAGVIITNEPIINYVARDTRKNTIHLDKYDAEHINLMKVDCLGLKTLTILNDCLQQINWSHKDLLDYPLDDDLAYKILRDNLYSGIFQFEGYAVQGLTRKVFVNQFTDLVALTALARPGPLQSGQANEWCARRMHNAPVNVLHPMMADITADTYGLIVFQEQMLRIIREIGLMSWEDTTALRKGMSKSLGIEYFERYWDGFRDGAIRQGIEPNVARQIWQTVNTAGGYAFNKSHSVAYAMVSYWCMVLKAHFPLEFALATLHHTKNPDTIKQVLRELDKRGMPFVPYDAARSEYNWIIKDNQLIGGFKNINGVGEVYAQQILDRRNAGLPYSERQTKWLTSGTTDFDDIFAGHKKFATIYANPKKYIREGKLWECSDINEAEGIYVLLARAHSFKIRSLNETRFLIERNGMRVVNDKWLTLTLEDDSGTIPASVNRMLYARLGEPLRKEKETNWFLIRGQVKAGIRRMFISEYKVMKG